MKFVKTAALLMGPVLLAACHTDPFSMKPETNAQLPPADERPVIDEPADPAPSPVPAPQPGPDPIPEPQPAPDPIPEPVPGTLPAPEPDPAPAAPAPEPNATPAPDEAVDVTPIPRTEKLVRGLINGSTLTLRNGQTLTLAMNANRSEGYEWQMAPLPEGLELAGEFYREGESPFPGRASIGGARYFLIKSNSPGAYPIHILHIRPGDTQPRVTKSFTLDVSE